MEDVKRKWEAKEHYFAQYKKDGCRPPCIDLDTAIQGFNIDNTVNHARKMRTFFTRRLEPKTKSSNAFKWSLRPKRK